jgi:hypothetical protein
MFTAKLDQVGGRVVLLLDEAALTALNARIGDTINLEPAPDGVLHVIARETGAEDAHARGRAFLRRYRRTFERLS